MLPAEKMELTILKCVERSGPAYDTNIPTLAGIIDPNTPHHLITERLKDLHSHNRIVLSKIVGNVRVPFSQRFVEIEGENRFWAGGFIIEIAPGGRKYFEEFAIENNFDPLFPENWLKFSPKLKKKAVRMVN